MHRWRASGGVVLVKRNDFGLFVPLKCRGLEIDGKLHTQFEFALGYCTIELLAQQLESSLRSGDRAVLRGRFERCTRMAHLCLAHEWDFIITHAQISPFNQVRRLFRALGSPSSE